MKDIMAYFSSHPLAIMASAFAALLICYFLFKKIIKLALFLILVALALGGYYYFKDPAKAPENIGSSLREARAKSGKLLEKSKQAYDKGKDMFEKGKEMSENISKLLNKREEKQEPGSEKAPAP